MNSLVEALKKALGDTLNYSFKSQYYHWNVEGIYFSQLHKLFGNIYEDAQAATDLIAELIRTLNVPAPDHKELITISDINNNESIPDGKTMVVNLENDNNIVIISLLSAYKIAETAGEIGISNALQDRIQVHHKFGWKLRATAK